MLGGNLTQTVCAKIRELLDCAVQSNIADCVLLSGGLDTSVVTALASKRRKFTGLTVSLNNAPDTRFASLVADKFQLRHLIVETDEANAESAACEVVKVMRSFDPMEIRNDATILIALSAAKDAGFNAVTTGDAGDELFAGYSFFFDKSPKDLQDSLSRMWRIMQFSSTLIARSLGMEARLPFLDEKFKQLAMSIPAYLKVHEEKGRVCGKWILRKAFEEELPPEIVWRMKMPIEQGSGTASLPAYFERKISDGEYTAKKEEYWSLDGVRLMSKEHLAYYEVYRKAFGPPRNIGIGTKACDGCGALLRDEVNYCRTCGAYPSS